MPRTRKTIFKQNLNQIPVLIEDRSQESVYFSVKQLNSVFTGGRNAFLITGTGLLEPGTNINVEIIDVNGNTVYLEAIKNFSEAGSRVITVEVYENTPRGPAILTIVGTARKYSNGNPIPSNWTGKTNLRWQKKLVIEPKSRNNTSIRIKNNPEIIASELFLTASLLSQSYITQPIQNFVLKPKTVLAKQKGYVVLNDCTNFQFKSFHLNPIITGSFTLQKRQYTGTIPATTESYVILESHTASLNLPLASLNASKSFTDVNITSSIDKSILNVTPLSNGQYEISDQYLTTSNNQYTRTASSITGSVLYGYTSESVTLLNNVISYANLRIIKLDTFSGEVFRVKTANKQAGAQTDFTFIADTPTTVGEILFATASGVQNYREQPIGIFNTDAILTSSWYAYLITGSAIPDPSYLDNTVSSSYQFTLQRDDSKALDSAYAITTASNYFFGSKQNFQLFPTSEYTFKLTSYVYTTAGTASFNLPQYNLDIYLTGSAVIGDGVLGQKIGTITTKNQTAYFPDQTFNFTVPRSGSVGVRLIPNGGFWQFSNISLKVAEEYAFSPDEVTLIIQNTQASSSLVFKTDLFDINNNALNLNIQSAPTFFTGSPK